MATQSVQRTYGLDSNSNTHVLTAGEMLNFLRALPENTWDSPILVLGNEGELHAIKHVKVASQPELLV